MPAFTIPADPERIEPMLPVAAVVIVGEPPARLIVPPEMPPSRENMIACVVTVPLTTADAPAVSKTAVFVEPLAAFHGVPDASSQLAAAVFHVAPAPPFQVMLTAAEVVGAQHAPATARAAQTIDRTPTGIVWNIVVHAARGRRIAITARPSTRKPPPAS